MLRAQCVPPAVHLFRSPAPKGRSWFQEINAAFGELHLPGWTQPRRCAAPLAQGCDLQGRACPAKPLQMLTTGPLNCLAPKGINSIFLFCEFSQWIHLTDSSAFPARYQDFQEEGSLIPSKSNQASHLQRHEVAVHMPRALLQLHVSRGASPAPSGHSPCTRLKGFGTTHQAPT